MIKDAHVWIARFASEDDLDEYMEETFADENDDSEDVEEPPISRFAADQGEQFYDHDMVYAQFHAQPDARTLIEGWGFPDDAIEAVLNVIGRLNAKDANTCFVADKDEFTEPKSVQGDGYELWYIGQFDGLSM